MEIVKFIIGACLIEYELDDLLRYCLRRNDDDTWKLVTGENGPFATFSGKILAGYAFDIYNYETVRNLTIVRRIRNAFAHSQRIVTFDHPLVAAEFGKIVVPSRKNSRYARSLSEARDIKYGGEISYVTLCTELSAMLLDRAIRITKRQQSYYKSRAKIKLEFVSDALKEHPELLKSVLRLYQASQNGDPTSLVQERARSASLGRMPKRIRKKDR
jgi:hypothetical protein